MAPKYVLPRKHQTVLSAIVAAPKQTGILVPVPVKVTK